MLHADHPRVAVRVAAQQAKVAAGIDHALMNPVLPERFRRPVDGVALGDTAEVELHAGPRQAHGAPDVVEVHVAVIDQGQGGLDLLWTGGFLPDAMEAPTGQQRTDGDVEGAAACASDAQGFSQHRGGTVADRHFLLRRESIQTADIALGPVQAHVTVHLLNGSKGSLDSLSRLPRQGVERLTFNRRTHHGQRPQKAGGGVARSAPSRTWEQKPGSSRSPHSQEAAPGQNRLRQQAERSGHTRAFANGHG